MKALFATSASPGPAILRLVLGVIMLAHGVGKVFPVGFLPGYGLQATVDYFHTQLGVPVPIAYVGALAEFVGGSLLVLGFLTRLGGLLIAGQMIAAAVLGGHLQAGFFANWFRAAEIVDGKAVAKPEGWEFHLALVAMALALVFLGGGTLSVDRAIAREEEGTEPKAAPAGSPGEKKPEGK